MKLSTLWDFIVFEDGGQWIIELFELEGQKRVKSWTMAHGTYYGYCMHMNSLTDELCEGFFPKPKLSKEERKALKAKADIQ